MEECSSKGSKLLSAEHHSALLQKTSYCPSEEMSHTWLHASDRFQGFCLICNTINQQIEGVAGGIVRSTDGEMGCATRRFNVAPNLSEEMKGWWRGA